MPKYLLFIALLCGLNSCKRDPYINVNLKTYKDTVFTNYFKHTSGWVAGDGASSIPLSNGQTLWTFGDSYIDQYDPITQSVPCLFDARNGFMLMNIANPLLVSTLSGNQNSHSFLQPANSANWTWPGPGYQNGDTIYVFCDKLSQATVPDTPSIAKVLLPGYTFLSYYALPHTGGINFTYSIIQDSDYYYLYGTHTDGYGNYLYVVRYPANNIYAPWQYYGTNGWSTDTNTITPIWDEFTSSFNVFKLKNDYVLITTEFSVDCNEGKNIYVATAPNPYGPFTNQHSVWQVDDTLNGDWPFFYIACPHPEFDNGRNEMLITYCINGYGSCFASCFNGRMDPNVYRPKAIRVPYQLIDPSL